MICEIIQILQTLGKNFFIAKVNGLWLLKIYTTEPGVHVFI